MLWTQTKAACFAAAVIILNFQGVCADSSSTIQTGLSEVGGAIAGLLLIVILVVLCTTMTMMYTYCRLKMSIVKLLRKAGAMPRPGELKLDTFDDVAKVSTAYEQVLEKNTEASAADQKSLAPTKTGLFNESDVKRAATVATLGPVATMFVLPSKADMHVPYLSRSPATLAA